MPEAKPSTASGEYLCMLQEVAYGALGYPAPLYDPEELKRRAADNRVELADGGSLDLDMQRKGIAADARKRVLEDARRANDQLDAQHNPEEVLALYASAPSPHVDPFHHAILTGLQQAIEAVPDAVPNFPYSDAIRSVKGKVTLSTMPTGQVNAKTISVPGTDEYLIVFDPVFFDFLYSMSIALAQPVDANAAQAMCERYATTGQEESLIAALQKRDDGYSEFFLQTLVAFFRFGKSPVPAAYDPQSFGLAEHLRHSGALFIAAHEYAHILLGHFKAQSPQERLARSTQPNTKEYDQEFEADWAACDILNACSIAARQPPPVRFMGAHSFFIGAAIIDLTRQTLTSGKVTTLGDMLPPAGAVTSGETHPMAALRLAQINSWIAQYLSEAAFRGTQFYCALLLEVAGLLWKTITPGVLHMHEQGVRPPEDWTGFDVFEHPASGASAS